MLAILIENSCAKQRGGRAEPTPLAPRTALVPRSARAFKPHLHFVRHAPRLLQADDAGSTDRAGDVARQLLGAKLDLLHVCGAMSLPMCNEYLARSWRRVGGPVYSRYRGDGIDKGTCGRAASASNGEVRRRKVSFAMVIIEIKAFRGAHTRPPMAVSRVNIIDIRIR